MGTVIGRKEYERVWQLADDRARDIRIIAYWLGVDERTDDDETTMDKIRIALRALGVKVYFDFFDGPPIRYEFNDVELHEIAESKAASQRMKETVRKAGIEFRKKEKHGKH